MKRIKSILTLLCTLAVVFLFSACQSQNPFESQDQVALNHDTQISLDGNGRSKARAIGRKRGIQPVVMYPLSGTDMCYWQADSNAYEGSNIRLIDGSFLHIAGGTLVPPAGWAGKSPVRISMTVEMNDAGTELIYTFGEHGSTFTEPARVCLAYGMIKNGKGNPKVYYILDDGTRVEQRLDQVDRKGNKIYLYLDHFSRYAVAYGR